MTSENSTSHDTVQPRPVIGRLPKYAAGKPPAAIDGLQSYKLSSNENPLAPLPEVIEAIHAQLEINRYPDPLATKLRNALAGYLDVPAEDIVTGAGSLGALNQILATFAGQNEDGVPDEVVYAWRSFEAYPICIETAGASSVQVPLTADGRHDLDAMAAAVNENTSVILLCTPNNPTGPVLLSDEVEDFIAKVPSNVLIVIDEAYQEFVRNENAVDGIESYRKHPNVVVLRTFSKAHGLANLRVGYSVSHPEITAYLRVAATPFTVSSLAEDAAVASLANIDKVVERVQSLVDERERVVAGLKALGWVFPETEGNFVWLPLGANSAEFAALAQGQALSVRGFANEGVRVSIGEVEGNTRFLDLCSKYPKGPGLS
ncbi:histidinol-phosphate transaminase [Paeniglutamicibacter cryotolerans]|uniref:Aromatic amino acid aminotransferase n=1 Tax=Paeniglutamicibacter cryotolerans TaxID=670079 RepID=A0A839QJS6_9MICC|nr:histidinol-phosphate transaminase [Paeniglutamicibacter cryotolerans]MBB2994795.1 histidinol-phosphate aminotransferase [Paeniglutamicibacter cryotolerans]